MGIHSLDRGKNLNGQERQQFKIPYSYRWKSGVHEPLALVKVERLMAPGMSHEVVTSRNLGKIKSYQVVH